MTEVDSSNILARWQPFGVNHLQDAAHYTGDGGGLEAGSQRCNELGVERQELVLELG